MGGIGLNENDQCEKCINLFLILKTIWYSQAMCMLIEKPIQNIDVVKNLHRIGNLVVL